MILSKPSAFFLWALLLATAATAATWAAGVAFPGRAPGQAMVSAKEGTFTLENDVLAATWEVRAGQLRPSSVVNKLTGQHLDQRGAEIFRLTTQPPAEGDGSLAVAVRLEQDKVVVLAGKEGAVLTEMASYPRGDFPGEPKLVRVGKMNLKAEPRDYSGEPGAAGSSRVFEVRPAPPAPLPDHFTWTAPANRTATAEFPFPAGARRITARIDKGTDTALSWSPAVALVWEEGSRFLLVGLREKRGVFNLTTAAGERTAAPKFGDFPAGDIAASTCRLAGEVKIVPAVLAANTRRLADAIPGVALEATLLAPNGVQVHWQAELRDGSNYLRQTVELTSPEKSVPLLGVELADLRVPAAQTIGTAPGCPVAGRGFFLGVEMPGARNLVDDEEARIGFACTLELSPRQSYRFGAVTGVAPEGQLRRSFLCYVERERARASQPFLHYNCWYDLGYGLTEDKILDVVQSFDAELVKKRGVPVQSYLADDGWDDPAKGLWAENLKRFPQGFAGLKEKMARFGAHLGIWISPLGGYGGDKERLALARGMGLVPETAKLDLSYPAYRKWFEERCLELMREGGVNAFKWDRAGEGVSPHFMALLQVAQRLRRENPDVFINVTVGTWPSPFWLNHVDSTWRMGSSDVGWAGKGDDREKWLTFRDGYCHRLFVELSPLYPLNSVMHHGVVHGRAFQGDKVGKSGNNLRHEARSYFANGTMLQELYLTPSIMTPEAWDDVAASAKWAHARADVLRDAHWVGGDPLKLEPYGYAAWSPRQGTLMVRNPDDQPRTMTVEVAAFFELPTGAPQHYTLRSPYADQRLQTLDLRAGQARTVTLEPFEVLVFDATPAP